MQTAFDGQLNDTLAVVLCHRHSPLCFVSTAQWENTRVLYGRKPREIEGWVAQNLEWGRLMQIVPQDFVMFHKLFLAPKHAISSEKSFSSLA